MKEIEDIETAQEDANKLMELAEADLAVSDSFLQELPASDNVVIDSKLDIDLEDLLAGLN